MSAVTELYYGIWATLAQLPFMARAAVVVLCGLVPAWFAAMFLLPRFLGVLFALLSVLLRAIFLLVQTIWYLPKAKRSAAWGTRYNAAVERNERVWNALSQRGKSLRRAKYRLHLRRLAAVYAILLLLIGLPQLLGGTVDRQYLPYFSVVRNLYASLEAGPLARSAQYPPLVNHVPPVEESAPPEPSALPQLQLNARGRAGSNVRSGPGKRYGVITTVRGGAVFSLLDDSDEDWYRICLEDGTEGWISRSLVEPYEPAGAGD